jgi:hypothetical protein
MPRSALTPDHAADLANCRSVRRDGRIVLCVATENEHALWLNAGSGVQGEHTDGGTWRGASQPPKDSTAPPRLLDRDRRWCTDTSISCDSTRGFHDRGGRADAGIWPRGRRPMTGGGSEPASGPVPVASKSGPNLAARYCSLPARPQVRASAPTGTSNNAPKRVLAGQRPRPGSDLHACHVAGRRAGARPGLELDGPAGPVVSASLATVRPPHKPRETVGVGGRSHMAP